MTIDDLKSYCAELDKFDTNLADKRIAEKGIESFLSQQLVYLDCTRVINGMRMMQTIGYPYQREISFYLYALDSSKFEDKGDISIWKDKLIERHTANLEYEKENPPIWYGGKKAKDKWDKEHSNKPARRKKVTESTLLGFGKEVSASATLKAKLAGCADVKFKIKFPKKD